MIASSALSNPGNIVPTANTNLATAIVGMVSFALEVFDRPTMDSRSYFSPFNKQSPVYGFDRDTADTQLTFNVITPNGPVGTVIHTGQMADITIKDRQAEMQAISKTRIDLDKSLTLPVVFGNRENCSIDWLATWAMARGGQWAGPAPGALTRWWAPLYGSTHAHLESIYAYNGALNWTKAAFDETGVSGPYGQRPPSVVPGPFLTGMFACQTAERTEEIFLNMARLDLVDPEGLPTYYDNGYDSWQLNYDQFSQASSAGRITFWIRGDPHVDAPAYLPSGDNLLMRYNLYCLAPGGGFLGWVIITIRSSDRQLNVFMGSDAGGGGSLTFASQGPIPTDGSWNFVGVAWDYAAGTVRCKINGNGESMNSYWATNGFNDGPIPTTDAAHIKAGGSITNYFKAHLPVSDIQVESGAPAYGNPWTRHYPPDRSINNSYEGSNAIMRPTYQPIQAVAVPTPVKGWELLTSLARASMSAYRVNEEDNFEFLPLSYFGEPEQLTSSLVADTEVNAQDLDVNADPSKTRNVVTVKFDETRVATWYGPVLTITSAIEVPRGTSRMTFALDVPAVEIHRQSAPFTGDWVLTNLTAAQIAAPNTIPTDKHYFSVNMSQDGNGLVAAANSVTAKIIYADASTVTLEFTNKMSKVGWISNNGTEVPFLRILGYAVTTTEGYITARDEGSLGARRERALDAEMPWIQDRESATMLTQLLVTALAQPRPEVNIVVMGDPRRKPGQLVTLKDSQGTQADGTWRVMAVKHNGDGPQYTQNLQLTRVPPVGVWDQTNWDESIWSE
jgi:hypothetical protein